MLDIAYDIEAALLGMADSRQAAHLSRFFKTGPGDYGEGDKFLGIKNPDVRLVVKESWKATPVEEAETLVRSEWHEVRLCGLLILVEKYLKALKHKDRATTEDIFRRYTSLHNHINNWDLVDLSAIKIVGNHELVNPEMTIMDEWIKPDGHTMWQQRIAMVSTWIPIRHGTIYKCFSRAEILLDSPHDLLHKAAGWMMREVWKKGHKDELRTFLDRNVKDMPAIMLGYACEQMTSDERHEWQAKRRMK